MFISRRVGTQDRGELQKQLASEQGDETKALAKVLQFDL